MKILFNLEPLGVPDSVICSWNFHRSIVNDTLGALARQQPDYRVLSSDRAKWQAKAAGQEPDSRWLFVEDAFYFQALDDLNLSRDKIIKSFYTSSVTEQTQKKLKQSFEQLLHGWKPDVIISFEFHNRIFDSIFPGVMQIVYMGGMFKRQIVPPTAVFDPVGSVAFSFLNKYSVQIQGRPVTADERQQIKNLSTDLNALLGYYSPIKKELAVLRNKFDYLLLLCCQFNGSYAYDTECCFPSQWEMVDFVLSQVPPNVGVIVTEHNQSHFLQNGFLPFFKAKYPHFIYFSQLNRYEGSSLYALPGVDGIVNVSSTVGPMACLLGKKIFSLSKNYNLPFQDAQGLANVLDVLKTPSRDKSALLRFLLTEYNLYPFEYKNTQFLTDLFENYLIKWRAAGNAAAEDFYTPHLSIAQARDYILNYVMKELWRSYLPKWYKRPFVKKPIQVLQRSRISAIEEGK